MTVDQTTLIASLLTFVVALIAALASVYVAKKTRDSSEDLQTTDHAFQERVRFSERCDSLHEQFLSELRGADKPLPTAEGSGDIGHKLDLGMIDLSRRLAEQAVAASHTLAQIEMFCPGPAAEAA